MWYNVKEFLEECNLNKKNKIAVDAITEVCSALTKKDFSKDEEIIRKKYPHEKPLKARKFFTKKNKLKFLFAMDLLIVIQEVNYFFQAFCVFCRTYCQMFFPIKQIGKLMNVIKRGGIYFRALTTLFRLHLEVQMKKII